MITISVLTSFTRLLQSKCKRATYVVIFWFQLLLLYNQNIIFVTYIFMDQYILSALVTIGISLFTMYLAFHVWSARRKHKSKAYEHTDNKEVLIAMRAHMNTIENSIVFLPLLWVATVFSSALVAGSIWVVWFIARVCYGLLYLAEPKRRQIPFMVSLLCIFITALLGLYGICMIII